jgi:hypothetical protein
MSSSLDGTCKIRGQLLLRSHPERGALEWMCVFITAVPSTKLFAWGEGDSGYCKWFLHPCIPATLRHKPSVAHAPWASRSPPV